MVLQAPSRRVRVVLRRENTQQQPSPSFTWAKLVYRTPRGIPYDIAVLQVNTDDIVRPLNILTIADNTAKRGKIYT